MSLTLRSLQRRLRHASSLTSALNGPLPDYSGILKSCAQYGDTVTAMKTFAHYQQSQHPDLSLNQTQLLKLLRQSYIKAGRASELVGEIQDKVAIMDVDWARCLIEAGGSGAMRAKEWLTWARSGAYEKVTRSKNFNWSDAAFLVQVDAVYNFVWLLPFRLSDLNPPVDL